MAERTSGKRINELSERTTAKSKSQKETSPKMPQAVTVFPSNESVVRTVSDEEIARRAYALWEQRGRPIGSPEEDWHNAKIQLCGGEPAAQANH